MEVEDVSDDDFMNGPVAARRTSAEDGQRVQQREAKVWLVPVMNAMMQILKLKGFVADCGEKHNVMLSP